MTAESRRSPLYNAHELRRMFEKLHIDTLLARSGRNVAYLSGMNFPGTLGRLQDFANAPRAALVLWPAVAEPTLLVSNIARGLAERVSWIEDIRSYTEYVESPYRRMGKLLRQRGLGKGRIGVERREYGVADWAALKEELPRAELVDVTAALEAVRNIKTSGELALLQLAADIQDAAHREVFASARPGDTEKELHARMVAAMLRGGAEHVHGMLQSSSNPVTYGGEGEVPIQRGDAVRTDYVCYVRAYPANLSRMAVMGPPSSEQERLYGIVRDVERATIQQALRPDITAGEVYDFVRDHFQDAGFPEWNGSLVGHSVGVWWHQEEPMLVPGDERPLRSGMVIALEPILEGFWHVQDEILIGETPLVISDKFDTERLFEMG